MTFTSAVDARNPAGSEWQSGPLVLRGQWKGLRGIRQPHRDWQTVYAVDRLDFKVCPLPEDLNVFLVFFLTAVVR